MARSSKKKSKSGTTGRASRVSKKKSSSSKVARRKTGSRTSRSSGLRSLKPEVLAMIYHMLILLPGIGVIVLRRMAEPASNSALPAFHYKEALNFQLTVLLCMAPASIASVLAVFITEIWPVAYLLWAITTPILFYSLIVSVIASGRAHSGEKIPYPLSFRFLK